MGSRQLHLGAFMRPVSIHTGAWRYPGAFPDANFNLEHLKRFARKLEKGKFDAVMFWKFDRLARDHNHTVMIKALLRHQYELKLFCVEGVSEDVAREAFRRASAKLAVQTTFVQRQVM